MQISNIPKIAVLGTGSIGMRHLSVLKRMQGVYPVAISRRKERLIELKKQGFSTASDLTDAASQGVALCIIATDTMCHVNDGLLALDLGFNLLIEKPLAVDSRSAEVLRRKAGEKNCKIFIACNLRFSESLRIFREWLPQIGVVYSVYIGCQSWLPDWRPNRPYKESYSARAHEGGVLRDLIHEIDYAGWIFGWPKTVSARLKNTGFLKIESEEIADLWWETPQGAMVSVTLDYLTRLPRRKMVAYGQLGHLEWDGIENKVVLKIVGKAPKIFQSKQSRDEIYLEQLKNFLDLSPDIYEPASLEDGLKALAVCDTARISSKEGNISKIVSST